MAANIDPIYSRIGDVQWAAPILTANTAKDGTGTVATIFTADATNGGYVQKLRIRPVATNVATVVRIWINNGSTTATAINNSLFDEISVAATTNIETASIIGTEIPMNLALPAGYKITAAIGTTVAGGIAITAVGGKY